MSYILDFQQNHYSYMEEINQGILKHIDPAKNHSAILDVGAGKCSIASSIKALKYEIYAIEKNETIAEKASANVNRMICADITDIKTIKEALQDKKFKYIIFSDILEHVYDPLQLLHHYLPFLEKEGKFLVSLPNMVNWSNRIRFMFGIFNYEMTGTMDRTHIRFFTFRSAKKLIQACGCTIEKTDCTPFIIRALLPIIKNIFSKNNTNSTQLIHMPAYKFYLKYCYPLEYWMSRLFPSLFAFQIILVARKAC